MQTQTQKHTLLLSCPCARCETQYPMTDARLSTDEAGRVTAEVPLDGTIYDLR
jgi:hypothetical protein